MKKSQKWQKLITTVAAGTFIIAALLAGESQVMAQDAVLPPPPPGSQYEQNADGSYSVITDGTGHVVMAGSGGFHAADGSGPPSPPGASGGSGGGTNLPPGPYLPDPGTNLWLLIQQVGSTVVVTLSNTVAGSNYLLLASTNVDGPWITTQSLLAPAGNLAVAYPIGILANSNLFFIAEQAAAPGPLSLKWVASLVNPSNAFVDDWGPGFDSSPAISPLGPIYITTGDSNIFSIDPVFGDVLWTNSPPDIPPQEVPNAGSFEGSASIAPDGTVYACFFDGSIRAYGPLGLPLWTNMAGDYRVAYSTPAISGSGLIIETLDVAFLDTAPTATNAGVATFNSDFSTNWFFMPQDLFTGYYGDVDDNAVVGPDGTVYFAGEGSRFYALSPAGHLKFFLPIRGYGAYGSPNPNLALEPDGSIIVGDGYGNLYCLNPDGSLRWVVYCPAITDGANFSITQPVIGPDGVIYTGGCGGILSLNPDGTTNWFYQTAGQTWTTPALAADGTLYFGDWVNGTDGNFYALNTNGTLIASNNLGAAILSSPAIGPDGSVVVACENGSVYCFFGSAPLATNAWMPMYQHDPAHSGQVSTNIAYEPFDDCGAPFVFNGDNDGLGHFYFSMTGPTNSTWNVYASTNLAQTNWTLLTNVTLDATTGNAYFTNDVAEGTAAEFYVVSRSNCNSKVIGFVSNSVPAGFNLVADQLYQVDDGVIDTSTIVIQTSTLNALFGVSNAWGVAQSETIISKWNGSSFDSVTNVGVTSAEWFGSGAYAYAPGEMTIVPGTSVFMNNVNNASFPVWFNGLVREQQIFHVDPGTNAYSTNYLSVTVPEAGYITNIIGFSPRNGDTIKLWDNTSNAFVSYPYISNTWVNGAPYLAVGQGYVLITSNSYTWTNSWQPASP